MAAYKSYEHVLEDGQIEQAPVPVGPSRWRLAAAAASAFGLCAGLATIGAAHFGKEARHARVQAAQQKMGLADFAEYLASGIESGNTVAEETSKLHSEIQAIYHEIHDPSVDLQKSVLMDKLKRYNLTKFKNMSVHDLLNPKGQDRNDGNFCADDEEEHAGLCYKKCADITGAEYPIRSTAWSCCKEEPCSFFNSVFTDSFFPCHGYAVAGKEEGQGCPHAPGDCMPNEEYSLGLCYKKCAILTDNKFPYRSGAATCCRYHSHLACIDALNVNSSADFNCGGGLGDGDESTPAAAHQPMQQLTES